MFPGERLTNTEMEVGPLPTMTTPNAGTSSIRQTNVGFHFSTMAQENSSLRADVWLPNSHLRWLPTADTFTVWQPVKMKRVIPEYWEAVWYTESGHFEEVPDAL